MAVVGSVLARISCPAETLGPSFGVRPAGRPSGPAEPVVQSEAGASGTPDLDVHSPLQRVIIMNPRSGRPLITDRFYFITTDIHLICTNTKAQ